MARTIREVDGTEDVTLEEIQSAGLALRDAKEAVENAKLVLKAAKETEAVARDRVELLTGAKVEERPLWDGEENHEGSDD